MDCFVDSCVSHVRMRFVCGGYVFIKYKRSVLHTTRLDRLTDVSVVRLDVLCWDDVK
jgi:hypothetical protein